MFDNATHLNRRRASHDLVSAKLAALDDEALGALIRDATPLGFGITGPSRLIELDGIKVFVKAIPLADIERAPGNVRSTKNVFDLPLYYQYGVGSAGFGVWRELACNEMATGWVLGGDCVNFPLLHHWRILPRPPQKPTADDRERLDQIVEYWNASPAIRARIEAIRGASAAVVLCQEYFPQTLIAWLDERLAEGGEGGEAALLQADEQMNRVAAFVDKHGMAHFDMHFYNVVTDGEQVYATDFGLAIHTDFDLSADERAFFDRHRLYDRCYVPSHIAHWIANAEKPFDLTPRSAALVARYQPIAGVLGGFLEALRKESKTTPYPAEALEQAFRDLQREGSKAS